jgi:ACT domain-containing protein
VRSGSLHLRHDVELRNDPGYLLSVFSKVKSNVVLVYRILHGARDILHLLSE